MSEHKYFIINKPHDMVSQFVSPHAVRLLGDLEFKFPEGIHAIGRLDKNSEGLLLLTTNKKVTRLLFLVDALHKRVYLVQINNVLSEEKLKKLRDGITIKIKGGENYITKPCSVDIIEHPEKLFSPIQDTSAYGVHTWIQITLTEGKYHQVRKMIGAIHHRVKRLIRISIENISLNELEPGEVKEMNENTFFNKLNIHPPA